MSGIRELLAVILGIVLAVLLVAAPRTALRLSVFHGPQHRRGEYGSDGQIPDMWVWSVRILGMICLAVAAFIAYQAYA
jgi:hypothetical protein